MADPFDVTNSDTPGSNGDLGPDFYRNLMQFGLATMAAGATPGATTLGALGKGGLAATQSARENSQARAQQGLYSSEVAKNNLGNQLQLAGVNSYRQYNNQPPLAIGPNGQVTSGPMQSVQQPQAPSAPPDQSQNVAADVPSSSTSTAGNEPQESSGMAGPVWASTPGATRVNNMPKTNQYASPNNTPISPFDPPIPGIDPARWRATVALQQINPQAAQANQKALIDEAQAEPLAAAQARGKGMYPSGPVETRGEGGVTIYTDPNDGQQKMVSGRYKGETMQGAGTLTPATVTNLSGPMSTQSGSVNLSPGTQQGAGPLPPPPAPADIHLSEASTSPLANAGPSVAAPAASEGTQWPVPVKNPAAPFGVQPGENLTSLPEYVNKWRDENYPKMTNLQNQMQQQVAIDDSIENLKGANVLQPGPWAESRLATVNAWNTVGSALGHQPTDSSRAAASAAEFMKAAQQNTNASAHDISSRGTNFDLVSAAKANPQYSMPYLAAKITNSMNGEAVARNYNRIKYIDDRLNNGVSESQATQEFEKQQPGDLVVKRAESIINPINAKPGNIDRLLPGTKYKLPGGQVGYVPIPPSYPFMVPYTNPLMKIQQQGAQ